MIKTSSGQSFLLYSDYSYELVDNTNGTNPFQNPKGKKRASTLSTKYKRLIDLLNDKEILAKIEAKKLSDRKEDVAHANFKYSSISLDILQLRKFDISNKSDANRFELLYKKYIIEDTPKTLKEQYPIPTVTGYNINTNVDCIEKKWIDQKTNTVVKQSKTTPMVTYTPDRLKNYYKQKSYLTIYNQFETRGDEAYITFDLIFRSKDIIKSYGHIETDGFVRLTFLNGKNIFLTPLKTVRGEIQPITGFTKYSILCRIKEKFDLRLLQNQYIGELGIMWSSGFEPYPIYNVSFFMDKLKCFNGAE